MSIALADTPKFTISRTGLEVHDHLSFEEWSSLAPMLNEVARGVAFVIGDWLLYGKDRFGEVQNRGTGREGGPRVATADYEAAVTLTGRYSSASGSAPSATSSSSGTVGSASCSVIWSFRALRSSWRDSSHIPRPMNATTPMTASRCPATQRGERAKEYPGPVGDTPRMLSAPGR